MSPPRLVRYPDARRSQLLQGTILVADRPAVFRITGPGAVTCIQGIVSHDVVGPGPNAVSYGALLSPKGMIIVDLWTLRLDDAILLVLDAANLDLVAGLLTKQLPPRLAKAANETGSLVALRALGFGAMPSSPDPGRILAEANGLWVARGGGQPWFQSLTIGPVAPIEQRRTAWLGQGAVLGDEADVTAAKVIAGFPSLGAEIGDKTLPQEVDYDRLGGVSYTKGCFVGQETVARLHFRGHPNWLLRRYRHPGPPTTSDVVLEDKLVARLGAGLVADDGTTTGLALVRREIEPDPERSVAGFRFSPIGNP